MRFESKSEPETTGTHKAPWRKQLRGRPVNCREAHCSGRSCWKGTSGRGATVQGRCKRLQVDVLTLNKEKGKKKQFGLTADFSNMWWRHLQKHPSESSLKKMRVEDFRFHRGGGGSLHRCPLAPLVVKTSDWSVASNRLSRLSLLTAGPEQLFQINCGGATGPFTFLRRSVDANTKGETTSEHLTQFASAATGSRCHIH